MAADQFEEFAGDRAGGEVLRRSLQVLSDRYADQPLGRQIRAVLDGRMTMRQLADDPELASMAHEGMRQYGEQWNRMTPEERAALMEDARRAEAAVVQQLARESTQ